MPVMDGIEAARILKAGHDTKHIPIIALTASAMPEDRERIMEAGFDGYVSKPIDIKHSGGIRPGLRGCPRAFNVQVINS